MTQRLACPYRQTLQHGNRPCTLSGWTGEKGRKLASSKFQANANHGQTAPGLPTLPGPCRIRVTLPSCGNVGGDARTGRLWAWDNTWGRMHTEPSGGGRITPSTCQAPVGGQGRGSRRAERGGRCGVVPMEMHMTGAERDAGAVCCATWGVRRRCGASPGLSAPRTSHSAFLPSGAVPLSITCGTAKEYLTTVSRTQDLRMKISRNERLRLQITVRRSTN